MKDTLNDMTYFVKKTLILLAGIVAIFFSCAQAQNKLNFGANTGFIDSTLNKLIENNIPISFLRDQYNLQFLRYPGGTPTRYFIWDDQKLSKDAMIQYSERFKEKNEDKAKKVEKLSSQVKLPDSVYFDFLKYCRKNNITPIIQLNTFYYAFQNKINPVSNLNYDNSKVNDSPEKWKIIGDEISKQVLVTHQYINEVYWEIGNEDYYILDPEVYGKIVSVYSKSIKDGFPQDKIIIQSVAQDLTKSDNAWIIRLFNYLEKDQSLQRIDYLGPHYYKDRDKDVSSQSDLISRIKGITIRNEINDYENYLIKRFSNKNIKLFFTEFSVFRRLKDKNYNTQMHAILLCEYLMQFYSNPIVFGVIHHGFVEKPTALFFEKAVCRSLNYSDMPKQNNTPDFPYVPPQTELVHIFFENMMGTDYKLIQKNDMTILVSNSGNGQLIILNYSDSGKIIPVNNFITPKNSTFTVKQFHFGDLSSHAWNPEDNLKNTQVSGPNAQLNIGDHTLAVINF